MEYIIGREGNQPFKIDNTGVSRRHARLEILPDGGMVIEDLGSANGTFVNGQRVVRRTLTLNDQVRLGLSYPLDIRQFAAKEKPSAAVQSSSSRQTVVPTATPTKQTKKKEPALSPEEMRKIRQDFAALRQVYDRYEQDKIAIRKEAASARVKRMLPPLGISFVSLMAGLFIGGEMAFILRPLFGVISLGLVGFTTYSYYKVQTGQPERLAQLEKQFKIDYVCPHCGVFLGDLPFENLRNQGHCRKCKVEWV